MQTLSTTLSCWDVILGNAAAILLPAEEDANLWRRAEPRELLRSWTGTLTNNSWSCHTSIVLDTVSQGFLVLTAKGILNDSLPDSSYLCLIGKILWLLWISQRTEIHLFLCCALEYKLLVGRDSPSGKFPCGKISSILCQEWYWTVTDDNYDWFFSFNHGYSLVINIIPCICKVIYSLPKCFMCYFI